MYIVFEGIPSSGKTTQSKLLTNYLQEKSGNKKVLWTREPGGSEIADDIRQVAQVNSYKEKMNPVCEAYLYASSRAQTLNTIVQPNLQQGNIVIADRSFITSLVFQGHFREIGVDKIFEINKIAINSIIPDIVIYINSNPTTCYNREKDLSGDKFERLNLDFYKTVYNGYTKVKTFPIIKDKWIDIDGNQSIEQVSETIVNLPQIKLLLQNAS